MRREHVTFVSPHPKSLSLRERDFELLLPFSLGEKGLGDVSVAARSAGMRGCPCKPDMLPISPPQPPLLRGEQERICAKLKLNWYKRREEVRELRYHLITEPNCIESIISLF
jgi:hypothetical protein